MKDIIKDITISKFITHSIIMIADINFNL
jgi:hypothetical protein